MRGDVLGGVQLIGRLRRGRTEVVLRRQELGRVGVARRRLRRGRGCGGPLLRRLLPLWRVERGGQTVRLGLAVGGRLAVRGGGRLGRLGLGERAGQLARRLVHSRRGALPGLRRRRRSGGRQRLYGRGLLLRWRGWRGGRRPSRRQRNSRWRRGGRGPGGWLRCGGRQTSGRGGGRRGERRGGAALRIAVAARGGAAVATLRIAVARRGRSLVAALRVAVALTLLRVALTLLRVALAPLRVAVALAPLRGAVALVARWIAVAGVVRARALAGRGFRAPGATPWLARGRSLVGHPIPVLSGGPVTAGGEHHALTRAVTLPVLRCHRGTPCCWVT